MKCKKCGFENKDKSKFCTKCGSSLNEPPVDDNNSSNSSSRYVIVALVIVIVVLVAAIGYLAFNMSSNSLQDSDNLEGDNASDSIDDDSQSDESYESDDDAKTRRVSSSDSSQSSKEKSWESIGSYSGSGSGSQSISVPPGKIKVELSAFPIKNYATNHLYVSGSNGESGGVDWGSTSAVETRSDSFTYESSSEELFTIDYYETVSWEVEFYRYQ